MTIGDGSYIVQWDTGFFDRVWREDIITDEDQLGKQYVVALYPDSEFRCRLAARSSFVMLSSLYEAALRIALCLSVRPFVPYPPLT